MSLDSSFSFTASSLRIATDALVSKVESVMLGTVGEEDGGWPVAEENSTSSHLKQRYDGHGTFEAFGSNLNGETGNFSATQAIYSDDSSVSDGIDINFDMSGSVKGVNGSSTPATGTIKSISMDDGAMTLSITGSIGYADGSGFSVNMNKGRYISQWHYADKASGAYLEIKGKFGGEGNDSDAVTGEIESVVFFDGTTTYTYSGEEIDLADLGSGTIGQFFIPETLNGGTGEDTLSGGGSNDELNGGEGDDTLAGGLGSDTLEGGEGDDSISGGAGDDDLVGGDGDDILDGGTGNDVLDAGSGNNLLDGGVGTDTVVLSGTLSDYDISVIKGTLTFLSFTGLKAGDIVALTATDGRVNKIVNVEQVQFAGDGSTLSVTKASLLAGAATYADDKLTGSDGNDSLDGLGGKDTLTGGLGNDTIDGGTGNDKLVGGAGDDTYYVDASKDTVTEKASEGTDSVIATVSYTLANNIEVLTLSGSASINGTGNTLANNLTGGSGINSLNGKAGNDTLAGGDGNDIFVFNTKLNALTNVDVISDFVSGSDSISLSKSIFTAYKKAQDLSPDFVSGAGASALDSSDHFIYDTTSGNLYYDRDGVGTKYAAVQFATLTGAPSLSASDLHIV